MQLNYRGTAYVYVQPAIATYETEVNGTFLGARYKLRRHQAPKPSHAPTALRFLGCQYMA